MFHSNVELPKGTPPNLPSVKHNDMVKENARNTMVQVSCDVVPLQCIR